MDQNDRADLGLELGAEADTLVEKLSVADLVRRWLNPADSWKLALVQRHEVWDELRMKRLLDSLLASYPIGTLLVCRVRQKSKVLVKKDDTRIAVDSPVGSWQLLDGQQRINSLGCIFTDKGHFGRFMVDMFARRYPDEIVTRRRAKREATKYIKRVDTEKGEFGFQGDGRERYLDLSRWYRWADRVGDKGIKEILDTLKHCTGDSQLCVRTLNDIDPGFADAIDTESSEIVAGKTRRLLEIWTEASIPVQKVTLDTPLDVLQVFTRANLEGVRLDGEDVFFAAVKTMWNDAEENLDRVARATTLINRMTALRLLARLASRGVGTDDLQPLRVDRLNGPKGGQIIDAMRHMAQDGSEVLARIGILGELLTSESRMGYGLREVNPILLDHVFGWAAVNPNATDAPYLRSQLQSIETYFMGATTFQYPLVFLDTFARLGFAEALAAGSRNEPFPLQGIVTACHEKWHELKRGRRIVPSDESEEDHLSLADKNSSLFLSIAQNLPYDLPLRDGDGDNRAKREVEWDHIYAQALAKSMRVPGEKSGRFVHHHYRDFVWSAGNLWALDRPLNTSAQDLSPSKKIALLEGAPKNGLPSRWPPSEDAFLTESERELVTETEELMAAEQVNEAMDRFREFARGRGLRLYGEIKKVFPAINSFAPIKGGPRVEYEPPQSALLRSELGLDDANIEPVPADETLLGYPGFESVFAYGTERGTERELRMIIDAVREIKLYARPYRSSVMITPRNNRTRMIFTIRPKREEGGSFAIYRSSEAIAEFFPSITKEQAAILGPDGWGTIKVDEIPEFIVRLKGLFVN